MVQPIILEKLEQLSESLQTEVLHYIEFMSMMRIELMTSPLSRFESSPSIQVFQRSILEIEPDLSQIEYPTIAN